MKIVKKIKAESHTIIVLVLLMFASLLFVNWISSMAFKNTYVELQEQYLSVQVKELIQTIETSLNFGKNIESYYGMEDLLAKTGEMGDENLEAAILNVEGEVLYSTLSDDGDARALLAALYSKDYQKKISEGKDIGENLQIIQVEAYRTMVFPLYKNESEFLGHMVITYQKDALLANLSKDEESNHIPFIIGIITVCAFLILLVVFAYGQDLDAQKKYLKLLPISTVMAGVLVFIVSLFLIYQNKYNELIHKNAVSSAELVCDSLNDLIEKGFEPSRLDDITSYINNKVLQNDAIGSISIVEPYYDSFEWEESESEDELVHLPIKGTNIRMEVSISGDYVKGKIQVMSMTFLALFVICLMITYELSFLASIVKGRMEKAKTQTQAQQYGNVSTFIRLFSFVAYTGIYTSMPYAAVIMKNWGATVFGLSRSISASLPLTVELLCVVLASMLIQKIHRKDTIRKIGILIFPFLILGNLACVNVSSPYILILLRAFCGIGFAFLKYWLNALVVAGSESAEGVSKNFGKLNGGLLGGITVGASLGAILAQAMGYQFNYYFTAIISAMILLMFLTCVPFKFLELQRAPVGPQVQKDKKDKESIFKDPVVVKTIIFGCIPLNIGLMYVVAFLPTYMDSVGQSALATSYAYLINGLAGVYLGSVLTNMLKKISLKMSVVVTFILCLAGILVLILDSGLGVIFVSAGLMGLFDGFGTPSVTSYFNNLPQVKRRDATSMLTLFNSAGNIVQILCPLLYNLLIQPKGQTQYLTIFGLCYILVPLVFLFFMKEKKVKQA
ncbi:MFS transporter [Lachnospiraceae bacterium ZAX-1]